jgi:hypothetical protein
MRDASGLIANCGTPVDGIRDALWVVWQRRVIVGRCHFLLHRTLHLPGTVRDIDAVRLGPADARGCRFARGGFLAHEGVTRYPITLIVALLGVIAGDNSLYIIGRGLGSNLLSYFGLKRSGAEKLVYGL